MRTSHELAYNKFRLAFFILSCGLAYEISIPGQLLLQLVFGDKIACTRFR